MIERLEKLLEEQGKNLEADKTYNMMLLLVQVIPRENVFDQVKSQGGLVRDINNLHFSKSLLKEDGRSK